MEYGIRRMSTLQLQYIFYKALNQGCLGVADACQREVARRIEILKPMVDAAQEYDRLTATAG